jgi:hypothetical protein
MSSPRLVGYGLLIPERLAMKIEKSEFVHCAKRLVDLGLDPAGQGRVYEEFCIREPRLRQRSLKEFLAEYVPVKLALGCVYWVGCCAEHRIEEKDLRNLYFKEVMGLFGSARSLEDATRFSECLYASNAEPERSPVLGVLVHFFHKLNLEAILKPGEDDAGQLNTGFTFMMEVCEALKIVFENQFNEFFYSHESCQAQKERPE